MTAGPNDSGYWQGSPYSDLIAQFETHLATGEALLTLTGVNGSGKTALCRAFSEYYRSKNHLVFFLEDAPQNTKTLQQAMINQLPELQSFGFITSLEKCLSDRLRKGQTSLLIIDNAHMLGVEAITQLRIFSNLQSVCRRLLQIVLVGSSSLTSQLKQNNGFIQRISAEFELKLMNQEQLSHFVTHANQTDTPLLTTTAITALYQLTEGKPGPCIDIIEKVKASDSHKPLSKAELYRHINQTTDYSRLLFKRRIQWLKWPTIIAVSTVAVLSVGTQVNFSELFPATPAPVATPPLSNQTIAKQNQQSQHDRNAQAKAEQIAASQAAAKKIAAAKQAATEQAAAEQAAAQQVAAEQAAAQQVAAEQVTTEQATAQQVAAEQVTTEQATAQQVTTEQADVEPMVTTPMTAVDQSSTEISQNLTVNSLEATINQWALAWQSQNLADYFSHYSTNYIPDDNTTHEQWRQQRSQRISKPTSITIAIKEFSIIEQNSDSATVEFWLSYHMPNYSDITLKRMILVNTGKQWVIDSEQNIKVQNP